MPAREYRPDHVSQPGSTVADLLADRHFSHAGAAAIIGISSEQLHSILLGTTPITDALAHELGRAFGVPARFWLKREARYRASLRR